jgi:two-component system OmpR family sensor kinase
MVDDLLLLARARAERLPVRPRPTDVVDLTASSVARFAPVAEARGVRLGFEPEDPLQAEVDPDRVDQILGNLLANSLRYARSSVRVSLRREAGHAVWTVEDDGPGFAPGLLATAKEPFVRGDPARGRDGMAGLGLAIAEALARAHSGDLRLGRTIDGGARVVVSIPEEAKATGTPSHKLHTGNTEGSRGRDTLGL